MILEYFKQITQIPHCSLKSDKLMVFLVDFAKKRGYQADIDDAKNIYIVKGEPKLCLQAHYDMVCVGDAPDIELIKIDGFIKAKNSSLGADNGIAIAMMMVLIEERYELEFLFTSNEEVGLLGANSIDFKLKSKYMLNLDSEKEGEICIGCAGGVDIKATKRLKKVLNNQNCYEVSLLDLPGGHSGVDIDKQIPNAIIELAKFLKDKKIKIANFSGGERINSIPSNAKAIICSNINFDNENSIKTKKIKKCDFCYDIDLASILANFKNGVLDFNDELNIPNISQNLALIYITDDILNTEVSLRAMSMEELDRVSFNTIKYFKDFGFEIEKKDKYPAWKPEINNFVKKIKEIMQKEFGKSDLKAIHAGLECGVLKQKYPNIDFASIGPTIYFPHSKQEMVEIDSIYRVLKLLKEIVNFITIKD